MNTLFQYNIFEVRFAIVSLFGILFLLTIFAHIRSINFQ